MAWHYCKRFQALGLICIWYSMEHLSILFETCHGHLLLYSLAHSYLQLIFLFFFLRHPSLTLNGSRVFVGNHGPHLPFSKILVLFVISNIIWYQSNQHTDSTTHLFLPVAISLVVYLLYLSKFSISDSSSYAENVFWPILINLAPALYPLRCFLSDDILIPELPYNIVSIITQDKPHMIYIILRLIISPICNFAMQSKSSTLLLFF